MKTLRNKGSGMVDFAVTGVVGFIIVAVILYVMFPILGGVSAATPTQTGAMLGAQNNVTANVAAGAALTGIAEIVIPATVILGILIMGLLHRAK